MARVMKDHEVQLVCFDLGRVLVRLANDREHAARIAGFTLPSLCQETIQAWEALRDEHELGQHSFDQFAVKLAGFSGLRPDQHRSLYEAWLCGGFDGVGELIDQVNARVTTACLSNTNDLHWRMMTEGNGPSRLPLERLTYRFASHLIGVMKPDARIYRHVESQTGVAGHRIVFFDDHPPNVDAAHSCGWQAFRIEHDSDPVVQMRGHLERLGVL